MGNCVGYNKSQSKISFYAGIVWQLQISDAICIQSHKILQMKDKHKWSKQWLHAHLAHSGRLSPAWSFNGDCAVILWKFTVLSLCINLLDNQFNMKTNGHDHCPGCGKTPWPRGSHPQGSRSGGTMNFHLGESYSPASGDRSPPVGSGVKPW